MATTIEHLITLQECDRRMSRLRQESKDVPARKEHIESRVAREKKALAEAEEELKKEQSAAKQVELDVEARRERINKMRTQQFEVKSNDDYRTLEKEIKGVEKEIVALEDRELEIMEAIEATRDMVRERKAELRNGEDQVVQDQAALDERMKSIEKELADLQKERDAQVADLDPEWVSRYDRIFAHTGDFAIVGVDHQTCGGCHMKLPPQVAHDSRDKTSMILCPYCSRMLYWQQ